VTKNILQPTDNMAERTFIAIKPDGVQRGLIGEVISRFEKKGFQIVAMKLLVPSKSLAESHYEEHKARPFFGGLVNFITSGPVCAMVWQGKGVIAAGRALIGATDPLKSLPGTIRGDFGIDVGRNLIHGSDSADSSKREIELWFKSEELTSWSPFSKSAIYEL